MTNRKPRAPYGTLTDPALIAKAKQAVRDGKSVEAIAADLGVCYSSAVLITRKFRDVRRRKRQSPKTVAAIIRAYRAGARPQELAEKYGISLLSAYRYTKGIERPRQKHERRRTKAASYSKQIGRLLETAHQIAGAA